MILDIPNGYTYTDKNDNKNFAYEKNGILYINGDVSFEKLIYHLISFSKRRKRCFYCNRKLHSKIRSIDHMIPKYWGGVTVPDNLVFSCKKCNGTKSIMTAEQYETFMNLPDDVEKKKEYKNECFIRNENIVYERGFCIPEDWVLYNIRTKIYVDINFDESYKSKRYQMIKSHYKKYHKLPRPIIISGNNILLDNYHVLMFAKNKQIKKVPILQLENVIVE